MSVPTPELNKALADLQTQLPRIIKDKKADVGKFKYKFADLATVSDAILPLLGKLGLSFTSRPTMSNGEFVLAYELRHTSGEQLEGEFPLPRSVGPQDIGIWITYARRYSLTAITGIAPDTDDDAASVQAKAERPARTPAVKSEPGVTTDQQRQMSELFNALKITDKIARIKYVVETIERDVHSVSELTRAEGGKLLDRLETSAAQVEQNESPVGDA